MWLMKRVGAPVASPDGKWVVFQVVEPAYIEANQVSDLWIVPADGSAKPRRHVQQEPRKWNGLEWAFTGRDKIPVGASLGAVRTEIEGQ